MKAYDAIGHFPCTSIFDLYQWLRILSISHYECFPHLSMIDEILFVLWVSFRFLKIVDHSQVVNITFAGYVRISI